MTTYTGEAYGGPYDGGRFTSQTPWLEVAMCPPSWIRHIADDEPKPTIELTTGQYEWDRLRKRWHWRG